jgi:hypothetical protein
MPVEKFLELKSEISSLDEKKVKISFIDGREKDSETLARWVFVEFKINKTDQKFVLSVKELETILNFVKNG